MLAGSCMPGNISKYQNGTPKVNRKAFNVEEVWNPVCCHGKKTVEFELWSTSNRILLQRILFFCGNVNTRARQRICPRPSIAGNWSRYN